MNKLKNRIGVVYSTNPDFKYLQELKEIKDTLPKNQQKLKVLVESKNRGGKTVTLITGFIGREDDLSIIGKYLKTKCGVGGSVKGNEIIIQGDFKIKIIDFLKKEGYTQAK